MSTEEGIWQRTSRELLDGPASHCISTSSEKVDWTRYSLCEGIDRSHVQVVRGLVKKENVRVLEGELGEDDTASESVSANVSRTRRRWGRTGYGVRQRAA